MLLIHRCVLCSSLFSSIKKHDIIIISLLCEELLFINRENRELLLWGGGAVASMGTKSQVLTNSRILALVFVLSMKHKQTKSRVGIKMASCCNKQTKSRVAFMGGQLLQWAQNCEFWQIREFWHQCNSNRQNRELWRVCFDKRGIGTFHSHPFNHFQINTYNVVETAYRHFNFFNLLFF